jgi:hypothetical protein
MMPGSVVENNVISNLYGSTNPSSPATADFIIGFSTSLSANATVKNNVITLDGGSNPSNRNIIGISEGTPTSSVMNYYYNSVNVTGTCNGANNTYAFQRSFATGTLNIRNNIFSNSRVASTGSNIALANEVSVPTTGWNSNASNYNALYSLNNATLTKWGTATLLDLAGYQAISGCDLNSVSGDPGFTSNSNLLPDVTNPNCWTLSGNGTPLSTIGTDINGNPRSTLVMTGATDIGAYEFTPTVQPPVSNQTTAAPGFYNFVRDQDTITVINLLSLGTLADINVQYFSGQNPPGLPDSTVTDGYGNVYWEIHPTDTTNTGYTYNVTLHYTPAVLGTITNENNIKVAKNGGTGTYYVPFTIPGTGPGEYQLDTARNTITVYGLTSFSRFILTDGSIPLPVELSAFTAEINRRDVNLKWSTSSETNNSGFDVERKSANSSWTKITNVHGNGTTTSTKNYEYTDKNLASGKYEYRLKQIDFNGNFNYFNLSSEVNVGLPTKFDLSQNYPNPFNPSTKINFDLPVDGKVSVILYDITGKEVAKLVNEVKTAGYYTISFNGSNLASGMYFYRITAEGNGKNFVETKKMMLVK